MVPLPQVNKHLRQCRHPTPSISTMISGAFDVAHTQSEVSIDTTPAIEIAFYYLLENHHTQRRKMVRRY